ncbi:hypothetical protein ACHAWF_004650 [Thalassiosira exigua]
MATLASRTRKGGALHGSTSSAGTLWTVFRGAVAAAALLAAHPRAASAGPATADGAIAARKGGPSSALELDRPRGSPRSLALDIQAALAAATEAGVEPALAVVAEDHEDEHGDEHEDEHEGDHVGEDDSDHQHNDSDGDVNLFISQESEQGHDHEDHVEGGHDHGDEHEDEHHDDHDDHQGHEHGDHEEFRTASSTVSTSGDKPKPWGYVILATLLVNLTSLSGLILLLIPALHRGYLKLQGQDPSGAGDKGRLFDVCVPAFAVGALMSTAVFLVLPEALHLIEGKHSDGDGDHSDHRFLRLLAGDDGDDHGEHDNHGSGEGDAHAGHDDSAEAQTAAKFGVAVLGGFLLPMIFGMAFHRHSPAPAEQAASRAVGEGGDVDLEETEQIIADRKLSTNAGEDETGTGCDCCTKENKDVETGVVVREVPTAEDRLPSTIVLEGGDGPLPAPQAYPQARNGPDEEGAGAELPTKVEIDYRLIASVVVGDAFCNFVDGLFVGASFLGCSWATTLSILMVTLFHELPQEMADFLLLTRYAGLSTVQACVVNFGSGLIVTLGGIVVLAGSASDEIVGVILAMAGGCYFNIAACETVPRIERHVHVLADRAAMVLSFILGTVPIGLVLLKHEHC